MAKNVLIFSDGTGQAGGVLPDEKRSNIYKLFRATRCGRDTDIDPAHGRPHMTHRPDPFRRLRNSFKC